MMAKNDNQTSSSSPASEKEERLKKLEELVKKGINPYTAKVKRDYSIARVLQDFAHLTESEASFFVAGRLR
ncbi:MAG: hypothetical protein WCZ15_03590, partial [Patescibacteria group bacterium]